jgi:trimeric autotransporter adhesin
MKKLTILLGLVFAASFTWAETKSDKDKDKADLAQLAAEVVAVDRDAKTITVKSAEPAVAASYEESLTLPVQGKAEGSLKKIATGDRITLTCRADRAIASASAPTTDSDTAKQNTMSRTDPQPSTLTRLSQCTSVTEINKVKASASSSSSSPSAAAAMSSTSTSSSATGASSAQLSTDSRPAGVSPSTYGSSGSHPDTPASVAVLAGAGLIAEVVSADQNSQTLTVKTAGAAGIQQSRTLSVDTSAAPLLQDLQSGQQVRITCRSLMAPSAGISGSAGAASASAADLSSCSSVATIAKVAASSSDSQRTSSLDSPAASPLGSPSVSVPADAPSADMSGKQRTSQQTSGSTATTGSTRGASKVNAVVVTTDATSNTITVRNPAAPQPATGAAADAKSDSLTLPVEGKATANLKSLKAGDRVMLTCRDGAGSAPVSTSDTSTSGASTTETGKAPSSTKDTTAAATASGDTGWSMAKAGKCAAVTDISKASASTSSTETDTMKSPSSKSEEPKPKKNY